MIISLAESHFHDFDFELRMAAVGRAAERTAVPVEGELGYVPGVEGEDAERHPGEVQYTSAEDAKHNVDAAAVDFLAVSIGTVHGRMRGEPKLAFERLAQINQRLQLVIHGGTGLSEAQFHRLIETASPRSTATRRWPTLQAAGSGKTSGPTAGPDTRQCGLVRCSAREVIESYRDQPEHRRFTHQQFRPYADGCLSIDFEDNRKA